MRNQSSLYNTFGSLLKKEREEWVYAESIFCVQHLRQSLKKEREECVYAESISRRQKVWWFKEDRGKGLLLRRIPIIIFHGLRGSGSDIFFPCESWKYIKGDDVVYF